MSIIEQACGLAALVLYDDDIPITKKYYVWRLDATFRQDDNQNAPARTRPLLFSVQYVNRSKPRCSGIPITAEKISTLLKAANISVESFWATLIAKLLEKRNVDDLILNVGSGGGGASVAVAAPAAGGGGAAQDSAPAVEDKKEEPKEESDEDMGFSLFD